MGEAEVKQTPKPPLERGERHPTRHFVLLIGNLAIALACFIGAGVLVFGQHGLTETKKTSAIESPPTSSGICLRPAPNSMM